MTKRVGLILLTLLVSLGAYGDICTIDQVPAATMLLPYFEVDMNAGANSTTLFSINNASATAVLAHVVVWTDLSVPTLDFDVYLTGYDVVTVNLRDIFVRGQIPRTASAGQDAADTISPKGDLSQDINFASCNGKLPPPNPALNAAFLEHLRRAHTGLSSALLPNPSTGAPQCAGRALGDNIARGYVTIDTVNSCSLLFPGDPGYFGAGGTGTATNQNVLWGDWFMVDPDQNFAQGEALVAIEAARGVGLAGTGTYGDDPQTTIPGEYTFYGRYVGWTAADNREPLATTFAVRYINGAAFTGGTDLLVWRDSKVNQQPFACPAQNGRPLWYPLGFEELVIFDEQEQVDSPPPCPVSPCPPGQTVNPFPAETQRVEVGGAALPLPNGFQFGWMLLDLNQSNAAAGNNPPEDPLASQAWVVAVHDAEGRYSVGLDATQLDSACGDSPLVTAPIP